MILFHLCFISFIILLSINFWLVVYHLSFVINLRHKDLLGTVTREKKKFIFFFRVWGLGFGNQVESAAPDLI